MNDNVDIFIYSHIPFKPIVSNPVYKILTNSHAPDEEFQYQGLPTWPSEPTCGVTYDTWGRDKLQMHAENNKPHNLLIYRDYVGDNISDKNLMYNEYAGFYWILHNWELKDYIGMFHYRRYYNFLDDVPDIGKIFSYGFKIILNKRFPLEYGGTPMGNRDFYAIWHNVDDFDLMGKIVKENYPQYADGWDKMCDAQYIFPSSLFIMPKELFKEYITYALDVMDKFNKARGCETPEQWMDYVKSHLKEYVRPQHKYYNIKMQARATGYLVERCLAAFLMSGEDPLINHAVEFDWSVIQLSPEQLKTKNKQ